MARETKVGLLVGLCVILLIGIIVSDHLSVVQHQFPAPLTAMSPTVNDGLTQAVQTGATERASMPEAADRSYSQPAPIPGPNDPRTTDVNQPPIPRVPNTPDPAVVNPGTHTSPANPADTQMVNGPQPTPANPGATPATVIQVLDTHTVQHGDTLYKLAKAYYHRGDKWTAISLANPTVIGPQGQLKDGTALVIPKLPDTAAATNIPQVALQSPSTTSAAAIPPTSAIPPVPPVLSRQGTSVTSSSRLVQVQANDTLAMLATRYLGSRDRWRDILDSNRDQLQRPEDLRIGMKLRLPDGHSAVTPANPTMLALHANAPGNASPQIGARAMNASSGTPATGGAPLRMTTPGTLGTPGTLATGTPSPTNGPGITVAAHPTPRAPMATDNRPGAPWPLGAAAAGNPVRQAAQKQIAYTVQANDSLEDIAAKTLGDPHKWPVILNANRAALSGQDHLQIGERLLIPISPGQ